MFISVRREDILNWNVQSLSLASIVFARVIFFRVISSLFLKAHNNTSKVQAIDMWKMRLNYPSTYLSFLPFLSHHRHYHHLQSMFDMGFWRTCLCPGLWAIYIILGLFNIIVLTYYIKTIIFNDNWLNWKLIELKIDWIENFSIGHF